MARRAAVGTILRAGVLAGVLDALFLFALYRNVSPARLLRGIAAGAVGLERARAGGAGTVALGVAFQLVIATGAAATYWAASRVLPWLLRRPLLAGPLFGAGVWLFMNLVVLPLSALPRLPFPGKDWAPILACHLFLVGLPIALVVARRELR